MIARKAASSVFFRAVLLLLLTSSAVSTRIRMSDDASSSANGKDHSESEFKGRVESLQAMARKSPFPNSNGREDPGKIEDPWALGQLGSPNFAAQVNGPWASYCAEWDKVKGAMGIEDYLQTDTCIYCTVAEVDALCQKFAQMRRVQELLNQPDKTKPTLAQCKEAAIELLSKMMEKLPASDFTKLCASSDVYMDLMTADAGSAKWFSAGMLEVGTSQMESGVDGWEGYLTTDWDTCAACDSVEHCNYVNMVCETYYPVCAPHGANAPRRLWWRKSRPEWEKVIEYSWTLSCQHNTWDVGGGE